MVEQLTIAEASARLGVSVATIRRRLKAGQLAAEKVSTPQGYEWRVCLETPIDGPATGAAQATPGYRREGDGAAGPSAGEVEALRGTVAILERELDGRNREVERLTELLSREQELVRAMQLALPAGDQAAGSRVPTREQPAPTRPGPEEAIRRGWWSRLVGRLAGA